MHVEAFMLFQPRLHFGMLVGGVVVDDQVQLKMLGRFSIDLLEKLQPLLMPMLIFNAANQTPLKIAQSRDRDEIEEGTIIEGSYVSSQQSILKHNNIRFRDFFKGRSYIAVVFVDVVMQITLYGALTWIPLYLSDVFGFSLVKMGIWSAAYFLSGAIGSSISSYLSDKIFKGNRRVMILACLIELIPFIVLLASLKTADQALLMVALCGMGVFGNKAWGPFLAVPAEIFTPEVYGKAMGFVNGVGYMFTAFSAKIFAALVVVNGVGIKD